MSGFCQALTQTEQEKTLSPLKLVNYPAPSVSRDARGMGEKQDFLPNISMVQGPIIRSPKYWKVLKH